MTDSPWRRSPLGRYCDIQVGFAFESKHYNDLPVGPRLLLGANIAPGRADWGKLKFWPSSLLDGLAPYRLRLGDVVLAMDRPWIPSGIKVFRVRQSDLPCLLVQRVARLRGGANLDTDFLYYCLQAQAFTSYILGVQTGSTVPHISANQIAGYELNIPSVPEQRRIAAILGALDDKIDLNRRMNRTLEEMAQAIFKSWFIDFDGHTDLVDSELGPIPRGWRVAHLGEICSKIGSGATPRGGSEVYTDGGVRFIRSQNVYDFEFTWSGVVHLTDADARGLSGVTVEPNDVLINITGDSVLRTCIVDPAVLPCRVNQHVAIVRPKWPVPAPVIHLHLVHPKMKEWLLNHSAGGTRKAITKGHLEGVPIPLPPTDRLVEVGSLLQPLYDRRAANWAESRTLAAIRDTLLPKLISGEVRVSEADALVEGCGP